MKLPVPLPFVVQELAVVGFCEVLQHTPRAVTEAPPSPVTFPPLRADDVAILLMEDVVTVGNDTVHLLFISSFRLTISPLYKPE